LSINTLPSVSSTFFILLRVMMSTPSPIAN
jgi:hypothetical protein